MPLRTTSHPRHARLARAALLSVALGVNTACYTSHPVMSAPESGAIAVVTLNDRGRETLREAVGQNAERLEGNVVSRTDTGFVLAVRNVEYFGGASNTWSGEQVRVPIAGVRAMTERRFSKGRTALVIGAGVAAVVAFLVTRNIFGDETAFIEEPGGPVDPVGSSVRLRPAGRP